MAFVVELRRGASKSRTARKPGPRPAVGVLERILIEEEEFAAVLGRLGRHRLPTLAGMDAYGDTTLHGEAVASEVSAPDASAVRGPGPPYRRTSRR
ncbi:hypothetical protein ACWGDE_36930 [Streptomyces sp. NPDC054956]